MDEKRVGQQPGGVSDVGAVVRETQGGRDDRRGTVAGVSRRGGSGRLHGWEEGGSARVVVDGAAKNETDAQHLATIVLIVPGSLRNCSYENGQKSTK